MLRRESKFSFIGGIVTAILFGIPTIIAAIMIHWIFIICIPVLIAIPFVAGMPPSPKVYTLILPSKVTISTDTSIITSASEKFRVECSIDQVVKVIDMGEWYQIYVENKEGRFICQKSLLSVGTLDEFEQIFEDKIVR
ncbi:MAG: hypothetical protein IJX76_06405 [Clostridia bacterium]|nr:hypothetical protein [Clostridia bacterium]